MQRDKIKSSKTFSKEEFKTFLDQNPRKTYKELVKIALHKSQKVVYLKHSKDGI